MNELTEQSPGLRPSEMAEHYGITITERNGAGQNVAIISLGGQLDKEDLLSDLAKLGVSIDPNNLDIRPVNKPPPGGTTIETHVDLEVMAAICPAAHITIYRAPASFTDFGAAIDHAVDDGNHVISISWGGSEGNWSGPALNAFQTSLLNAAKKMVTVTVATGDGGSGDTRRGNMAVGAADGKAHVQMPACSEWVLACGGTELMDDGSVCVWNNSQSRGGATGGGVSGAVPLPPWQSDIPIQSANDGRHRGRIIPDVAALATFKSWRFWEDQPEISYNGGTSAVAPFWAALVALVNQERAANGNQPLGFFNDHLYALLTQTPSLLHNVTKGHNKPTARYPGYSAGPGFNACTGWGSLPSGNARNLMNALVSLPDRPADWFEKLS